VYVCAFNKTYTYEILNSDITLRHLNWMYGVHAHPKSTHASFYKQHLIHIQTLVHINMYSRNLCTFNDFDPDQQRCIHLFKYIKNKTCYILYIHGKTVMQTKYVHTAVLSLRKIKCNSCETQYKTSKQWDWIRLYWSKLYNEKPFSLGRFHVYCTQALHMLCETAMNIAW